MTLCPPENAVIDQKDGSVFVCAEAHGGSRAIAVRKEKGASESGSGRGKVILPRPENAVLADGNRPTSDGKRLLVPQ